MSRSPKPASSTATTSTFRSVVKNPVYLQVAEQMREAILAGKLVPGEALPTERALASQFGVSRASIREALRALQAQGLLSGRTRTAPHRTTVSQSNNDSLSAVLDHTLRMRRVPLADLIEVRVALESTAFARAAQKRLATHLAAARRELAIMAAPGIDIETFRESDVRFHMAVVAASGNEALHAMMGAVRESIASHLHAALGSLEEPRPVLRKLCQEHEAMLAAVEAGESERAASLVRQHIEGFYRRLQRRLREVG